MAIYTFSALANLQRLAGAVQRESAVGDIRGSSDDYANLYARIGEGVLSRSRSFTVKHDFYEPTWPVSAGLTVQLVRADGSKSQLAYKQEFELMMPNGILVKQAVSDTFQVGDRLKVHYAYRK